MIRGGVKVLDSETIAHETKQLRSELCAVVCEYAGRCTETLDQMIEESFGNVSPLDRLELLDSGKLGKYARYYKYILVASRDCQ